MASIQVKCPSCQGESVYRHGKARSGLQRYRCRDCHHCFQREYLYEANKPGVTDKISDMAMNGSGVRDTGRVLRISVTTVIAHLKNSSHPPSHRSRSMKPVTKPERVKQIETSLLKNKTTNGLFWQPIM
ncbi:InsA N-terminal domain-containing protein [Thiothrix eikelboomii]|uniref:InsA N-terminal domain-containing protein n=1 Tax=Thiothrix eikelboomii TaxID=92487 RepID=A0A1T4XQG5_9GAMM|nr:IS1-like element transposase [Thiothrix eikelboomii]SKA91335.1 InsA N-terminal domain-containing protein [Thiothrix eikelboomii]